MIAKAVSPQEDGWDKQSMVTISAHDTKKRKSRVPKDEWEQKEGHEYGGDRLTRLRHSGDSAERLNLPQKPPPAYWCFD